MRKHAFLIWLCIMLAIIVATMLAGSLHAQEYTQVGATFCGKDGQPHIVVDTTEDPADLIECTDVYRLSGG